jgi:2',3'-cyclic-nucleotide 2'-phosphodiesterase (5'-nucleotidase family)
LVLKRSVLGTTVSPEKDLNMSKANKLAHIRLVAINDVYELTNLPKLQTFLSKLSPPASAVLLAGDFLSPSPLSSIDGGRGMVATLRASGLTHCSLGNHEADLKLNSLRDRLKELSKSVTVLNTNMRNPPSKAAWMKDSMKAFDLIQSPCQQVSVALLGLISDEPGMFRNGTFKKVPIDSMVETYDAIHDEVVPSVADMVISMTHASMSRDRELAAHIVAAPTNHGDGIIIGGHEHEPMDETVTNDENGNSVRILKGGTDARTTSLIDLYFDASSEPAKLTSIEYTLVNLLEYDDSFVVKNIVDSHNKVVEEMENEIIADCSSLLPPGEMLSSERTRFQQTTVGAFFCQAIKEELEVDVALVNGASIKGGSVYGNNKMSYAELRKELPFPTKMVVIEMTRAELESSIHYSRTYTEDGRHVDEEDDFPRRGFIQTDWDHAMSISYGGTQNDILQVALPRNLLGGFCKIRPLMKVEERLNEQNLFPAADDFIPAVDLVVRYCSKHRWTDILRGAPNFGDLDLNHDGVLDRHEIKAMMKDLLGRVPPDFVVDDMIASIDDDENGVIDIGEFSYLLAKAERDQRW